MVTWALDAEERLRALDELGLYPGVADERFDCYTRLVSRLLDTPVALVSLVSTDRQFFPSGLGLPEPWATRAQTPLSMSFCQHVVTGNDVLAVTDARADSRVGDNLAIEELGVQAYLGVPLRAPTGEPLGSLCAIDTHPRRWTDVDLANLREIADAVAAMVGLRLSEHRQRRDANEASHRLRTPLAALRFEIEDAIRSAEVGDDDVVTGLHAAIGHVDRLTGIVDDLIAVARTRGRLEETMVDLA